MPRCRRADRGSRRKPSCLALRVPDQQRPVHLDAAGPRSLCAHHDRPRKRHTNAAVRPAARGAAVTAAEARRSVAGTEWRRHLAVAAGFAIFGGVAHVATPFIPVPLAMVGLGLGLVGAAFMLAWAADAGETVYSGGLVLAAVALVAVLPEFIIEVRFAFIQQVELVTANLTGATRLLLTGAS